MLIFSLVVNLGLMAGRGHAAGSVDLLAGPYTDCPGSGCAKGDYRWGSDGSTSANSWTLTSPSGHFTATDRGKNGVATDWAPNPANLDCTNYGIGPAGSWTGYACYQGRSCDFTVTSVNGPNSITVTPISGNTSSCGNSGLGFNSSGQAYWALYTDDTLAVQNAMTSAGSGTLTVPASYNGGIYAGELNPSAGMTLLCTTGATFFNPRLDNSLKHMFSINNRPNVTINGCTFSGTEPTTGAWYDPTREYDVLMAVYTGSDGAQIINNTFENSFATYELSAEFLQDSNGNPRGNVTISGNTFKNCGLYGLQMSATGGTNPGSYVSNNTFIDCVYGNEDPGAINTNGTQGPFPNRYVYVQNNTIYPTSQGGNGYARSQNDCLRIDASCYNPLSSVYLDCGTYASSGQPTPYEYTGVICSNNHVYGANSYIFPTPGTPYPTSFGETMSNNLCDNGCNGTPQTLGAVTVSPNSGSGINQSFVFQWSDPGGAQTIAWTNMLISKQGTNGMGACYMAYLQGPNQIGLVR